MAKKIYYFKGLHCASCELLIEQRLLEINGVRFVDVSIATGQMQFEYDQEVPSIENLNNIFKERGYVFSEQPFPRNPGAWKKIINPIIITSIIIIIFFIFSKLGLGSLANINSSSSLMAFLIFGLLAGLSSCAALVGGLVLSLSKQWLKDSDLNHSFWNKSLPHFLFNGGRIISYMLLGFLLGVIGEKFRISPWLASIVIIIVSLLMLILGLQMLGVRFLSRFRIALPKGISGQISKNKKINKKIMPFVIGFLTILLPCGFTLVAEGAAILSAGGGHGAAIMLAFVLGTTIPLLIIGLWSTRLIADSKFSLSFLKIAGLLIIFFVIYNLNLQFGLSRYINQIFTSPSVEDGKSLINNNIDQNVKILRAVYTQTKDIVPNNFEIKQGETVVLMIDVQDSGFGCMSTIKIPGLFDISQPLIKGQTIVMRFTPFKAGIYQITCAMGVPRGTIKVIN